MNSACPSTATVSWKNKAPMDARLGGSPILIRKESKGKRILLIVYHFLHVSHKGGRCLRSHFPHRGRVICMFKSTADAFGGVVDGA